MQYGFTNAEINELFIKLCFAFDCKKEEYSSVTKNMDPINLEPYNYDNTASISDWNLLNEEIDGKHSWFIEYYKKCKSGEIIVGQELITALDMYVLDFKNTNYRFMLDKAHKRIEFIENELKHFEAPFAGNPFILELFQKAIIECLFAFEFFDPEYNEWVRRFQEVLLVIGRKNGKTPFVAAVVLSEWFCGEMGQRVLCVSNDYEQASLIFDTINSFREESRTIEKVTRKNLTGIYFGNRQQSKKTGKFSKVNKGTIKKLTAKGKNKEGRNLKIIIADEVHEMLDNTTVFPMRQSLSTQKEPLYFEITTEGMVNDGYLDERLSDARKVLKGQEDRPRWLIWLYTMDGGEAEVFQEEASWVKANPLLGVAKKWSYLRSLVDEAKSSKATRAFVLAKEFNIKYSRPNALFDEESIAKNSGTFKLEDFRGCFYIGGVDLSEANDLAAISMLFMRRDDPTKYYHTMYFVPESKAVDPVFTESPTNPEKKNYIEWADEGLCRIVKGNIIDDNVILEYQKEMWKEFQIRPYRTGFDAWRAREYKRTASKEHGDHVPVQISMSTSVLHVPTCELEDDMREGIINFNNNPICIWNFKNTSTRIDTYGQVMPIKLQGYTGNKIDGTMTKVICNATLRQFKASYLRMVK